MKYPAVVTVLPVNIHPEMFGDLCPSITLKRTAGRGPMSPNYPSRAAGGGRGQRGKRYRAIVDVLGEGAESSVSQLNARSVGVFCSSVLVPGEHASERRMCVSTQNCLNDLDRMGVPSRLQ